MEDGWDDQNQWWIYWGGGLKFCSQTNPADFLDPSSIGDLKKPESEADFM